MNKELLYKTKVVLNIEQKGKTETEAFQNIFNQLRKQIHSEVDGLLIEMHVTSCILLDKKIEKNIKKFLFFFMPVEHISYILKARIEADVVVLKKEE